MDVVLLVRTNPTVANSSSWEMGLGGTDKVVSDEDENRECGTDEITGGSDECSPRFQLKRLPCSLIMRRSVR